jgi:hypothetical protein
MASQENTIIGLVNSPIIKIVGTVFLFGLAAARLEYKQDQNFERIIKKIDEHIITDGYEKQIQNIRVSQLEKSVEFQASRIDDIEEFIKPEEPKIKHYR